MLVDELADPMPLSWLVPALGIGLLVAVGLWFVFIIFWKPRARVPVTPTSAPSEAAADVDPWASARQIYSARVDELEHRFRAGELDSRGLHLALSATVRDFGAVRGGVQARYMTLRELRETGVAPELAWLIESYYHPAFSRRGSVTADAEEALEGARTVIGAW